MGRTGIKQATDGSDAANRGMELLRLLHVQLSKRSVGTLVLGQRTKFREIFFEKDQVYLCGDRYSGRLDLESLVALEIAGRRLSLAELDRLLAQSDLTRELFPQVLRAQNLISASEERDLLERHVREEISDLLLQNDESFHFQNERVPEQLLGSPTAVSTIAVPLEELIESIADRQRGLRELKELFPSFSEVLVKTEEGLAASQSPFTPAGLGKLLQLADGLRDIKAIIACSGLFEYFALRCLGDALEREFLKKTVLPELHGLDPETIGFEAAREALPIYRNAIKHAMDPVQVRQSIARLHEKLGEEESAIVQYNFIGDAYYRMGQPARAIEVYQRILELRPQDEMATQKIVRVYQDSAEAELARGNPEGAVKLHESAFTLCPDDETTLRRLTRILIDNGWEADLPELCERAIGHAKRTGDMEVAVRVCRTVLDICPNEATIQKKLVNAYLAFDRLELAAEAMADLARLLNARGQRARALDLAEKIRRLRVDNPEVQKVWRGLARELGMEDAGSRLGLTSTIFAIVLLAFTGYQVWTYYEWKDLEGEALAYAEAARASVQNGDPSSVSLEPDPRTAMLRGLAMRFEAFIDHHPLSIFRVQAFKKAQASNYAADALEIAREEHAKSIVAKAEMLLAEGRTDEVRAVLAPVLEQTDDAEWRTKADEIWLHAGERGRSLPALLEEARRFEREGDWATANEMYRRLLTEFPESTAARNVRLPIYIGSNPPGAEAFRRTRGGEPQALGTAPLVVRLGPRDAIEIELRAKGYHPLELYLDGLSAGEHEALLERKPSWMAAVRGRSTLPASLQGGLLVLPDGVGGVHGFDLEKGEMRFEMKRQTIHSLVGPVASSPEGIYLVWNDHRLHLIDPSRMQGSSRTPTIKASFVLDGLATTNALVRENATILVGTSRKRLVCLSRGRLEPLGEIPLDETPRDLLAVDSSHVLVRDDQNALMLIEARAGRVRWRAVHERKPVADLRLLPKSVLLVFADGSLQTFDRKDGASRTIPTPTGGLQCVDPNKGIIYRVTGERTLESVTLEGEVLRAIDLPAKPEALTCGGGRVIATLRNGASAILLDGEPLSVIGALRPGFRTERWLLGETHSIAIGPDENGTQIKIAAFAVK